MAWDPISSPVDYVKLAGQRTPGIAVLTGWVSPRKWDQRRGFALGGAITVFRGVELAKGLIKLYLYTAQDWSDWEAFRPLIVRPPVGERAKAMSIWHPLLFGYDITSVVVEDASQPEQDDDGVWVVTLKMVEWRRPKIQLAKPEAAKEKPVDPVDRRIEELAAQVEALADG